MSKDKKAATRDVLLLRPANSVDIDVPDLSSAGWRFRPADNIGSAMQLLTTGYMNVGLLLLLPDSEGSICPWVEHLVRTSAIGSAISWLAVTSSEGLELRAVSALIRECCYGYHTLPVDPFRLQTTLWHLQGMAKLAHDLERRDAVSSGQYGIVGSSAVMQTLLRRIVRTADADLPVLISGESGSGKELVARAIHTNSSRSAGPFIAVNCAALPSTLIHSELFGHEKGSFSGAHKRHIGRIEAASGGTLFLDEIGDLPLDMQVNLLRFLQENTIERLGSVQPIHVDARVVAATHVDLQQSIEQGKFREDLYYRLSVLPLRIPSLRERDGDIEELAMHFLEMFSGKAKYPIRGFSQPALAVMNSYSWPGNVRELINRVCQAVVLSEGPYIQPTDLDLEKRSERRGLVTLDEYRAVAEMEAVQAALQRAGGNVSRASQELGVSRVTFYRLMEKYCIRMDKTKRVPSETS